MRGRCPGLTAPGLALALLVAGALMADERTWAGSAFPSVRATAAVAAAGQFHARDPIGALAAGRLLVATRRVGDPTFARSVVLLFLYSGDGAAGLILNRQTAVPVERVLPDLPVPEDPAPLVFFGGPVPPLGPRALLRSPASPVDAPQVLPGVHLLGAEALDAAVAAGATADQLHVYVGYAGWNAGQLEREVRRGDWHVFDGDSTVVFDPDPETIWRRQIRLTELVEA